jgi:hypothetical protein
MTRSYTQHTCGELNAELMQYCIVCGAVISDYRNAMWPGDQEPPKGYEPGPVYVSEGNPKITQSYPPEDAPVTPCTDS